MVNNSDECGSTKKSIQGNNGGELKSYSIVSIICIWHHLLWGCIYAKYFENIFFHYLFLIMKTSFFSLSFFHLFIYFFNK